MRKKGGFSQNYVNNLINQNGGNLLGQCIIEEIAYHALLAELPRNRITEIINNPITELVKCDNIMFFRPAGQMSSGEVPEVGDMENMEFAPPPPPAPEGDPVVAVLDGLPLVNHNALSGRVYIDDPDDYANDYSAAERVHGTAMASLVVNGDLLNPIPSTKPVYLRPIMKPNVKDFNFPRSECIPDNVMPVDLIHRAVRRMFEGEGDQPPASPHVKIINLSIGDPSRHFIREMSPLARLLDLLSFEYQVLFIVSAGNHANPISLGNF